MSSRTSDKVAWWIIKLVIALTIGIVIYLIIRMIPGLYRSMVRKNHDLIPGLEKRLGINLTGSPGKSQLVSAIIWPAIFLVGGFWLPLFGFAMSDPTWGWVFLMALSFAGLLMGLSAGGEVIEERKQRKRLSAEPLDGSMPSDFDEEAAREFVEIRGPVRIRVNLPAHPPYNPTANAQLLTTLRGLNCLLDLEIVATKDGFSFEVVAPKEKQEQVKTAIRSAFPQASLDSREVDVLDPLFVATQKDVKAFTVTTDPGKFYAPINGLSDFQTIDPLSAMLQPAAYLEDDEAVIYQCLVRPAQFPEWEELGIQTITESTMSALDFLSVGGAIKATATAGEREAKFETPEHRAYVAKLKKPTFEALANVYITTPDEDRSQVLADGVTASFAQFDSDYNHIALRPRRAPREAPRIWQFDPVFPITEDPRLLVLTPDELASLWHLPSELIEVPGVFVDTPSKTVPPPKIPDVTEGVVIGKSIYQDVTKPITLTEQDRETHINIIGGTGTGKSTLMHHVIFQDITRGHGVAVIDPHGDLFARVLRSSIRPEREGDVIVFDLSSPDDLVPLGLFDVPEGTSKERAATAFMQVFEQMFERQWPTVQTRHVIQFAIRTLLEHENASLADLPRLFHDPAFRGQLVPKVRHKPTVDFWLTRFNSLSQAKQNSLITPVLNRLYDFIGNPIVEYLTCQPAALDLAGVVNGQKILLVNLNSEEITDIQQETISQILISKLQMASWSRTKIDRSELQPFYIVIDEVQRFTATSLPEMFAEVRKYGLSLMVANQYLGQLSGDTLEAVFGNVGTNIIFEIGARDAQSLRPYIKPTFDTEDVTHLDRFHAVVRTRLGGRTQRPFSIITPKPMGEPEDADEREQRIREISRERYALPPRTEEEPDQDILDLPEFTVDVDEEIDDPDYFDE